MSVQIRNNVRVLGDGALTLVFAHGFGCDQNMWRMMGSHFAERYRVVLFDMVGSGGSDISAYQPEKYASLQGYAADLLDVVREFGQGPVVFVGHSVSAMIGALADASAPDLFLAHVMIGPSPCYIDDAGYVGGFSRDDIDDLLQTLRSNYLGWSRSMAPVIMGDNGQPALAEELTNSFCRTDPEIAKQFAQVTFLSDNRADLHRLTRPVLIIQSSIDPIAPVTVGEYLDAHLPDSTLRVIDNVGHCPHLSAPQACIDAMDAFLATLAVPHDA